MNKAWVFLAKSGGLFFIFFFMLGCTNDTNTGLSFDNVERLLDQDDHEPFAVEEVIQDFEPLADDPVQKDWHDWVANYAGFTDDETLETAGLSPDEQKAGLIIDGHDGQYIALADVERGQVMLVTDERFLQIEGMRWSEDGQVIDYMVQNENENLMYGAHTFSYSLYRYHVQEQEVSLLHDQIRRTQMHTWTEDHD